MKSPSLTNSQRLCLRYDRKVEYGRCRPLEYIRTGPSGLYLITYATTCGTPRAAVVRTWYYGERDESWSVRVRTPYQWIITTCISRTSPRASGYGSYSSIGHLQHGGDAQEYARHALANIRFRHTSQRPPNARYYTGMLLVLMLCCLHISEETCF